MIRIGIFLAMALGLGLVPFAPDEDVTGHDGNAVFASIVGEGIEAGGQTFRLPSPTFTDDQTADEQRDLLREVTGSDRAVEGFLRPSITSPHILRLNDEKIEGATIRSGSLYFALQVDLDEVDPSSLFAQEESGPVEAGNMKFEARVLDDEQGAGGRLVHSTGRLLDRVGVESTSRVVASRSEASLIVASMTDRRFDDDEQRGPNRWWTIDRRGTSESTGPAEPYAGGTGYAKLTRLADTPEMAIVELHFAFIEPIPWFKGAPILRSKFSLIAQDQIRRLRREMAR